MTYRPGAPLSARPLHFVFLLDVSGSMAADGKIQALNDAASGALPALADLAAANPFVDLRVRVVTFSDGARWHVAEPTRPGDLAWHDAVAGGYTDLGAALQLVTRILQSPPMEPRAFPPVLVLVSDGQPTDDFEAGLERLLAESWGRRSVRAAIAIGSDADEAVLQRFIGPDGGVPLTARDPEQLAYLVRMVSTVASEMASRPVSAAGSAVVAVPPPGPSDPSVLTW